MSTSKAVCKIGEVPDGEARRFHVDGAPVCVVHVGDEWFAIGDTCSHAEYSLSEGDVWPDECEIECPKHGALFSLRTGEPMTLPATRPVPTYAVEIDGDDVVVTSSGDGSPPGRELQASGGGGA